MQPSQLFVTLGPYQYQRRYDWTGVVNATTARYLLDEYNTKNRRLSPLHVGQMAEFIAKKGYFSALSNIVLMRFVDGELRLIDGQHRLESICEEGVEPQEMHIVVVDGTPEDAEDYFSATATHKVRSQADHISLFPAGTFGDLTVNFDVRAAMNAFAICDILIGQDDEPHFVRTNGPMRADYLRGDKDRLTTGAWLIHSVKTPFQRNKAKPGRKTFPFGVMAAAIACYRVDKDYAEHFFGTLASGSLLGVGNPITLLHNDIMAGIPAGGKTSSTYTTHRLWYSETYKAWNTFVEGRGMQRLKVLDGEKDRERLSGHIPSKPPYLLSDIVAFYARMAATKKIEHFNPVRHTLARAVPPSPPSPPAASHLASAPVPTIHRIAAPPAVLLRGNEASAATAYDGSGWKTT